MTTRNSRSINAKVCVALVGLSSGRTLASGVVEALSKSRSYEQNADSGTGVAYPHRTRPLVPKKITRC